MKKQSQFVSAWPTAYNLIREMGLMKDLPPMNKIKLDHSLPQESGAFGYVTTEDADENGTLDTMHIVVPNIDRYLQGIDSSELMKLKIEDPERLKQILAPIVELIAHEKGHQKDYKPNAENPFPGGEAVADEAARQTLSQFTSQATNNQGRVNKKRSSAMNKKIVARLVKLAEDLETNKAYSLSDKVLGVTEKFAQDATMSDVQKAHAVENAQLYHPDGNLMGERIFTSQVNFDWGKYRGNLGNQPYYVASGRTELGSIQFPGDPYTYDPAGPGKMRVVSGPENFRYAIGRIIQDPRKPEQQAKMAPISKKPETDNVMRESMLGKLDLDIANEREKFEKIDRNVEVILNQIGWEGRTLLNMYKKIDFDDFRAKDEFLRNAIYFLKRRNYDSKDLELQLQKLRTVKNNYLSLVAEKNKMVNTADDIELNPEETEEEMEAYANLTLEEIVKNASVNAVFWFDRKTPFGR